MFTFLATSSAFGKSPSLEVIIKGNVNSHQGPIAGASVLASYVDWQNEPVSVKSMSNESEHYIIGFYFYPYSGSEFLGGDKCNLRLPEVEIAIDANGFESTLDTVLIQGRTTTYNKLLQPIAGG